MTKRPRRSQGMNWCRSTTRLALYLRDGLACVWCGASVEDGTRLTLDHIKPYSKGGTNATNNLVTCCPKCNSSRGSRTIKQFSEVVSGYVNHGVTAETILFHVKACVKRPLPRKEAIELIASRGSLAKVIAERQ